MPAFEAYQLESFDLYLLGFFQMNLTPSKTLIFKALDKYAQKIESILHADVMLYYGDINPQYKKYFIDEIENLAKTTKYKKLVFFITTGGGSVEMVEVMVEIMRHFYEEVYFIVPDYAYSAGTILCMSGDKIYMNYYSSLGPIDPQVIVNGKYVSAQGYIDQFNSIVEKSRNGTITPLELQMALNMNLADINFYEQARNLTVSLLKKWLVRYKFKDWFVHSKDNSPVTDIEKETRAEEIATALGNNALWNSHGRHIGMDTLWDVLKLKIENIQTLDEKDELINQYHQLAVEFAVQSKYIFFLHSKRSRR